MSASAFDSASTERARVSSDSDAAWVRSRSGSAAVTTNESGASPTVLITISCRR